LNQLVEKRKIKRALPLFAQVVGGDSAAVTGSSLEQMKQTYKNLENFMYGELNEVQNHQPDLADCQALEMPVAVAVTTEGRNSIFATSSQQGAERIGWKVVRFPGWHNVARDMPQAFAMALDQAIQHL
jgi:hypothetical protein